LAEETYSLTVIEDNDLQLTLSGERGPAGANGAVGAAGPNTVTTATTTNLSGFISGNGTNIAGATAAASAATPSTLVLRSATGGASFSGLNTNSGSYAQIGGENFNVATTANANLTTTGSGIVTVSGAGGTTISGGTLTFSPSGFTYGAGAASAHRTALGLGATGSIAASDPLTLTQTWSTTATYTGLQVNVTDSGPSNAASLLMDLQVGGASRFSVRKSGFITATAGGQIGSFNISTQIRQENSFIILNGGLFMRDTNVLRWSATANAEGGTYDLYLQRDAANTLAQRNGTAAQESRIYGTYSGAGADYRRLALKMSSAGVAQIVAEGLGSGALGNRIEIDGLRIGKGGGDVASNTALGASALNANTSGSNNSAVGSFALNSNTTGQGNSAVGFGSLFSNTTGSTNTAVGRNAGRLIVDGSTPNTVTTNSVYLGSDTKALASGQTNQIVIGHNAIGLGSNTAVLGNDSIETTALKGNVGIGTTSPASKLTVTGGDIEVTDSASGIILKSPNGTRYRVTISDLGVLSAASL
jgi:hypothetical protein